MHVIVVECTIPISTAAQRIIPVTTMDAIKSATADQVVVTSVTVQIISVTFTKQLVVVRTALEHVDTKATMSLRFYRRLIIKQVITIIAAKENLID